MTRFKRGRKGGEIDSRRLIRHPLGKVGEQFDHAGPILRQEIARPDRARVADGGRHQAGVGGLAAALDHRANGVQDKLGGAAAEAREPLLPHARALLRREALTCP